MDNRTAEAIIAYLERLGKEYLTFGLKFRFGMQVSEPKRFKEPLTGIKAFIELAGRMPGLYKELGGGD